MSKFTWQGRLDASRTFSSVGENAILGDGINPG